MIPIWLKIAFSIFVAVLVPIYWGSMGLRIFSGFPISLFVANLAFGPTPTLETAKVGILAASVAAGAAGTFILSKTNTGDVARAKRVSRQKGDRS